MRVRGGGARASGMGHSRDPAVLCTRRVRFWHVSDLMREGGQVNSNAGPSPQPSPRSCLARRGRKIIRGRRNPGRRSCLACPGLLSGHPYGISVWLAALAEAERSPSPAAAEEEDGVQNDARTHLNRRAESAGGG